MNFTSSLESESGKNIDLKSHCMKTVDIAVSQAGCIVVLDRLLGKNQ